MSKHLIAARLDRLLLEGERLRRANLAPSSNLDELAIWFATAIDTITLFLPGNSELLAVLSKLQKAHADSDAVELPAEALTIIRIASEVNRIRRSDDVNEDLRHDIQMFIVDTYRKSWLFYVPIVLLLVAFGFAVKGVFEVRDLKINTREEAAAALERAKQSIDQQQRSAESTIAMVGAKAKLAADDAKLEVERRLEHELQSYVADQRQRIHDAADKQIEIVKRERAPNLETALGASQARVDSLQAQLKQIDQRVQSVASSSDELHRAFKTIDNSVKGNTLDRVSVFLNRSRQFVAAEFIVAGLVLLLAIVLLIYAWRKG